MKPNGKFIDSRKYTGSHLTPTRMVVIKTVCLTHSIMWKSRTMNNDVSYTAVAASNVNASPHVRKRE
jgi:hypothetical protein